MFYECNDGKLKNIQNDCFNNSNSNKNMKKIIDF